MKLIRKKISELSPVQFEEIESLINSTFGTVFHEPEFNRIVSEVNDTEFSYYLVYSDKKELIAFCPVHSVRNGLMTMNYSSPAAYNVPYGGWVYNRSETNLKDLMYGMKISFTKALTYWSSPQIGNDDYVSIADMKAFKTGIIDLTLSLDEILNKCIFRKRRQIINSAIRKGVTVDRLDAENLYIFIEQSNYLKKSVGLEEPSKGFFERIYEHYSKKNQIMALASKINNVYLASGLIIGNKQMVHLWTAGKARDISMNVPRQELIVWESIKWAKEIGSRYYDLCVIEPERLPHIAQFKLEFSNHLVPFYLHTKRSFVSGIISRINRTLY